MYKHLDQYNTCKAAAWLGRQRALERCTNEAGDHGIAPCEAVERVRVSCCKFGIVSKILLRGCDSWNLFAWWLKLRQVSAVKPVMAVNDEVSWYQSMCISQWH